MSIPKSRGASNPDAKPPPLPFSQIEETRSTDIASQPRTNSHQGDGGGSRSRGRNHLGNAPLENLSVHNNAWSLNGRIEQPSTITPTLAHAARPEIGQVHRLCESDFIPSDELSTKRKLCTDGWQQTDAVKKARTSLGQTTLDSTSISLHNQATWVLDNESDSKQVGTKTSDPIHVKGLETTRNSTAAVVSKNAASICVTKKKPCFRIIAKRSADTRREETEHARAEFPTRPRPDHPRLKEVLDEHTEKIKQLMNCSLAVWKSFPKTQLKFIKYDVHSIPFLDSAHIHVMDQYPQEVVAKPSEQARYGTTESGPRKFGFKTFTLRQKALSLANKRSMPSHYLGRPQAPKSGPEFFIDYCDLYLYGDKVHVGTERGLLLAADYFKLLGIPDTQTVRFGGVMPSWMKQAEVNAERRRVLVTFSPSKDLEAEGCMALILGSVVAVMECGIFDVGNDRNMKMAYGMRLKDGAKGWFPYSATCRMDWLRDPDQEADFPPDSTIIDWAKFDYGSILERHSRNK